VQERQNLTNGEFQNNKRNINFILSIKWRDQIPGIDLCNYRVTAVPLSNQDAPDSYCIDAQILQVNRPGHVIEQADSSSRTERSGDPLSGGWIPDNGCAVSGMTIKC
jgi:hypothetical protein